MKTIQLEKLEVATSLNQNHEVDFDFWSSPPRKLQIFAAVAGGGGV